MVFFVKNSSLFVGELLEAAEAAIEGEDDDEGVTEDRSSRDTLPLPE